MTRLTNQELQILSNLLNKEIGEYRIKKDKLEEIERETGVSNYNRIKMVMPIIAGYELLDGKLFTMQSELMAEGGQENE